MKMVSANDLHYVDTDSLDWAPDPTQKRKRDPKTPTNTPDGSVKKRKTGNTPKAAIPLDDDSVEQRALDTPTRRRGPPAAEPSRPPISRQLQGNVYGTFNARDTIGISSTGPPIPSRTAASEARAPSQGEMEARLHGMMAESQRLKAAEEARAREEMANRERNYQGAADATWNTSPVIQNFISQGREAQARALHKEVCEELRKQLGLPPRRC